MKKPFALLLAATLLFSLTACGEKEPGKSQQGGDAGGKTAGWPTEGYGSLIPEPDWDCEIARDDPYSFIVTFENVSLEDRRVYTKKLVEAGFDVNPSERGEGDVWSWVAGNDDSGMKVCVEVKRILVEPS